MASSELGETCLQAARLNYYLSVAAVCKAQHRCDGIPARLLLLHICSFGTSSLSSVGHEILVCLRSASLAAAAAFQHSEHLSRLRGANGRFDPLSYEVQPNHRFHYQRALFAAH